VVLIQIAGNHFSSGRELLQTLAYSLIYANLTGVLGLLVVAGFVERLARRKVSLVVIFALCMIVVVPVGVLMAQTLLMAIGFVVPQHFWREYAHTLRVAMPLAILFGAGALVHALLRARIQFMEERLHEKE